MKAKISTIQKQHTAGDEELYNEIKQGLDDLVNGRFKIWNPKIK